MKDGSSCTSLMIVVMFDTTKSPARGRALGESFYS